MSIKMEMFSLILIIVGIVISVNSFNLESRLPIWKYGPEKSYFGYSIASHTMDNGSKWLVFCTLFFFFLFTC